MEPVQNCIGPGIEIGRSLGNKCKNMEKPLPEFVHREHLVGTIPVQKECLGKKRKEPVTTKK
tara:strand:+ start:1039 stop:1224 length:186 start_codon:yes stop_codon:yes gene_type:complete